MINNKMLEFEAKSPLIKAYPNDCNNNITNNMPLFLYLGAP